MIKEVYSSSQSFLLGLGSLTYFFIRENCDAAQSYGFKAWLYDYPALYCMLFYILVNIPICVIFRGDQWQVAIRGCFLGTVFSGGLIMLIIHHQSYKAFGCYLMILSMFHFLEYFVTAVTNPSTLSLTSYLLNHSVAYILAALVSWVEFFLERWIYPPMKELWYVSVAGCVICIIGDGIRKLSMFTANTNFNHIVQTEKKEGHTLVTTGIYQYSRHPSYAGWFWWSIGTQIILLNPLCVVIYAISSWKFFYERVTYEEMTLIRFFGKQYIDYKKQVGTGLPFISGYKLPINN